MASQSVYRSLWRASTPRICSVQRLYFSTSRPRRIEAIPVDQTSPPEAPLPDPSLGETCIPRQWPPSTTSHSESISSQSSISEPLAYHVSRTPANNLPVYHDTRNGNTRKETIIRKIAGDPKPLRDAIRELLDVGEERVWVGKVTGHVYVKGHHKPAIEKFLAEKGF